jgi:hypothetical protein
MSFSVRFTNGLIGFCSGLYLKLAIFICKKKRRAILSPKSAEVYEKSRCLL